MEDVNPGEVSQMSGLTLDKKANYSPQNYIKDAVFRIKKYYSYQNLCHFKVLKICDTSPGFTSSKLRAL